MKKLAQESEDDGWNAALDGMLALVREAEAERNGPQYGEIREFLQSLRRQQPVYD